MTDELDAVRSAIRECLAGTSLGPILDRCAAPVQGGKMLRARLLLRLGAAARLPRITGHRLAAAIELIQSASLLHDDVIDAGVLRRDQPAFWVEHGTRAAILAGDMLMVRATALIHGTRPALVPRVLAVIRDMCEAELEQEFGRAGTQRGWARCLAVARRKTGGLFGLAAGAAAAPGSPLAAALQASGTELGTAYQVADDLRDDVEDAGTGGRRTAVSAWRETGIHPERRIRQLLRNARRRLAAWPAVRGAWDECVLQDFRPVMGIRDTSAGADSPRLPALQSS